MKEVAASSLQTLSPVLLDESPESPLAFLDPLTPYERAAFCSQDARSDCVQRMVFLRAKCCVLASFAPRIRIDPGVLGGSFLESVGSVLAQSDSLNEETEQYVKEAVASAERAHRQGLNEASTRLHEAKNRLMKNVADNLAFQGLGTGDRILEDIRARVSAFRDVPIVQDSSVKFDRRSKKRKGDLTNAARLFYAFVLFGIGLLMVGGIYRWTHVSSHISPDELKVSISIERVDKEDKDLVLHVRLREWDQLDASARDEISIRIEKYLKTKKLRQAKILDETGQMLAAVSTI